MAFDVGTITEFDDPISILDPEVLVAAKAVKQGATKGAFWNKLRAPGSAIVSKIFEIYGRSFTSREGLLGTGGWDNAATTALPVSAALAGVITVGHVLKVDSEIVVVKAVDRTANKIDVVKRGAAETTAASHPATVTAKVISHAGNDTDLKKMESFTEKTNVFQNFAQTIFETIDRTFSEDLIGRKGVENMPAVKEAEAMNRIANLLAPTAILGMKERGTTSNAHLTAGLLQQLSDDVGGTRKVNRVDFAAAAFSETAFRAVLRKAFLNGKPDTILMSPSNKDKFNEFTKGMMQTARTDKAGGYDLNSYEFEGNRLEALVDDDMPNDRIAILTLDLCQKGWIEGDILRMVAEPAASSREKRDSFQGTFGIIIDGVGYDHLDIYNVG